MIDAIETAYLYTWHFLKGAWNSMYVWLMLGGLTMATFFDNFWLTSLKNVAIIALVTRFGLLAERDRVARNIAKHSPVPLNMTEYEKALDRVS